VNPTIFSSINKTVNNNKRQYNVYCEAQLFTEIVHVKIGDETENTTDGVLHLPAFSSYAEASAAVGTSW
jgi:hypothetical protein